MTLSRQITLTLGLCLGLLLGESSCRAGFTVTVETVTSAPGTSGFLEVFLTNTSTSDQTLSGFSIDLNLGGSGVVLTSVDNLTTPPYVFGGSGTGVLAFDPFPNSGFILSDIFIAQPGFTTLAGAQTVGLGRIGFRVLSGAAPGLRPLAIVNGLGTEFADASNNVISDLTLIADGVVVTGTASVPGPAALLQLATALGMIGEARRRSRRPRLTR